MRNLLFLFLLWPLPAYAGVAPSEFAWKMPLAIPPGGALYELALPAAVYSGVRTPSLADLCVFNGKGEVVPFAVSSPPLSRLEKRLSLPFFPLTSPKESASSLLVRVERQQSEVVSVEKHSRPGVAGWLIDASSSAGALSALELEWGSGTNDFVARVNVEASDDLHLWRQAGTGTLALLRREGEVVEHRLLELGGGRARYLRIVPVETSVPTPLKVTAVITGETVEQRRESVVAAGVAMKESGSFRFDLPGLMPVDRLRLILPQQNSLVRAVLFSRSDERQQWVRRNEGIAYRLNAAGGEVNSPEFPVAAGGERHWMVTFAAVGGIGSGTPSVSASWVPHRLRFIPRGEGPFYLAYGSGRGDVGVLSSGDLFAPPKDGRMDALPLLQASAGEQSVLGGQEALKPRMGPATRKKYLLWGALLAGVALLGWMALRLSRQMQEAGKSEGA